MNLTENDRALIAFVAAMLLVTCLYLLPPSWWATWLQRAGFAAMFGAGIWLAYVGTERRTK